MNNPRMAANYLQIATNSSAFVLVLVVIRGIFMALRPELGLEND